VIDHLLGVPVFWKMDHYFAAMADPTYMDAFVHWVRENGQKEWPA
jgi:hypothetical protein